MQDIEAMIDGCKKEVEAIAKAYYASKVRAGGRVPGLGGAWATARPAHVHPARLTARPFGSKRGDS